MKNTQFLAILVIAISFSFTKSYGQFRTPSGIVSSTTGGNVEFFHNTSYGGLWLSKNSTSNMRSQISFRQGSPSSSSEKFIVGIDLLQDNTNDFFIYKPGVGHPRFYISPTGRVAINTSAITASSSLFTVSGGDITVIEDPASGLNTDGNGADIYLKDAQGGILNLFSSNNEGRIDINNTSSILRINKYGGNVLIGQPTLTPAPTGGFNLGVQGNTVINGKLVIGDPSTITSPTPFADPYRLYITGGFLAEKGKIAIKTTSDWSDFVFDSQYKLRSLDSVEAFINQNKHLPDVPSAKEVVENGIDLAKMDATLLQKVEELTLYMIDLKKEVETLKMENEQLKRKTRFGRKAKVEKK